MTNHSKLTQHCTDILKLIVLGIAAWGHPSPSCAQPPRNLLVDLPTGRLVGLPIAWSPGNAAVLDSTGRIHIFDTRDVTGQRLLDDVFHPRTMIDASTELQAELGRNFETLTTGPYVIATPKGQSARWESRFHRLLTGYTRYFEVRGWKLRQPDFPLVVIVLPSRGEFVRTVAKELSDQSLPNTVAGVYLTRSNRCLLYQIDRGQASTDWDATETTIVHEAIHQLAYNTGIHERLFGHPLWFVEGLATMFEVPAVYDTQIPRSNVETRKHYEKSEKVKQIANDPVQLGTYFESIVEGDELFRTQPEVAYAVAWALTFYLSERMPNQYFDYVARQQQRGFQEYMAGDRQLDFRQSFEVVPSELAPHVLKFIGN